MRIKLMALGIVASLAATPAFAADESSREENVGVGAGAIVGAAAGGPIGAIVGAAIGAKLGDSYHRRNEDVETLSGNLRTSRDRVKQLEKEVTVLGNDLREIQTLARPELLSLMRAGIEMDLLFRTDEHVLSDTTGERLKAMAATLASMQDVHIKLDGFADERGDAEYNRKLSQRRAEYVRNVLVANGIPAKRIQITAHGESKSLDDSVDSYALERKVSLTLFVDESPSLASNPLKQ